MSKPWAIVLPVSEPSATTAKAAEGLLVEQGWMAKTPAHRLGGLDKGRAPPGSRKRGLQVMGECLGSAASSERALMVCR